MMEKKLKVIGLLRRHSVTQVQFRYSFQRYRYSTASKIPLKEASMLTRLLEISDI